MRSWVWIVPLILLITAKPSWADRFDFFQPVQPPRPFAVKAHRGLDCGAPENTRPAIEAAIADQLEWVEIDIRLTRDGHHVLFHDSKLDGKTTGQGNVQDHTLAELLELDAGSWYAPRYAGEILLTLPDALKLAKGTINLDLDGKDIDPDRLVAEVLAADMARQVVVFCDLDTLLHIREASGGKIAIMPKWRPAFGTSDWVDRVRPDAVEVDADQVTPALCKAFHAKGVVVQAKNLGEWDQPKYWHAVLDAGADVVQTDLPEQVIAERLWKQTRNRPVRLAFHRGASRYAPENTLPAIKQAVAMGADLIEIDVRTTRDGGLFLLHDSRLDRTTTGQGPIAEATATAIANLDAGQWFGRNYAGTQVPTFDAALEALGRHTELYLDAKEIDPQALADALAKHNLIERTIVYDGSDDLAELRALAPAIRRMPPMADIAELAPLIQKVKPYAVDVRWRNLSKELIEACHAAGVLVFSDAMGQNERIEAYQQAINWGIDGIQSDYPLRVMRAVEILGTDRREQE